MIYPVVVCTLGMYPEHPPTRMPSMAVPERYHPAIRQVLQQVGLLPGV